MSDGWRYYNHAMMPSGAPGEPVNTAPLKNGKIWHMEGHPLFARWVSDYDCVHETEWWYCLKDSEYRIDTLNAKRRYRITRGRKCFEVKEINSDDFLDELAEVQIAAFMEYPEEYRPNDTKEEIIKNIKLWKNQKCTVFGAFRREDNKLCGYSYVNEYEKYGYFVQQKVIHECEKDEINAALVDGILLHYNDQIVEGYPIVDGQRNLVHETAFQDYLCKYFGFRKVYCRLNRKYRWWVGVIVNIMYPHREWVSQKSGKLYHLLDSVLKMEEICRSFE